MPTITDESFDVQLLKLAQQGDEAAQSATYEHFAPQVFSLARHLLQCEAAAEDVVQDTFVEMLNKISHFRFEGSFAGWLRRIAVNHCLMQKRSAWANKRAEYQEAELKAEVVEMTSLVDIKKGLALLSPQARTILWLHEVEEYTHREIAELMGKTASFSKSQLARAHEKLRTLQAGLKEEGEGKHSRTEAINDNKSGQSRVNPCMPLLNKF